VATIAPLCFQETYRPPIRPARRGRFDTVAGAARDCGAMTGPLTTATLRVNGEEHAAVFPTHHTLLEVLREELGLTGTKHGCELGECGTCTVLLDGRPVLSCLVLAADVAGRAVETVEGMQRGLALHPLQAAFADLGAAQCGYCTPGILMAAQALLAATPRPAAEEIRQALAGNLCRCTGYHKIVQAVELAAARMDGDDDAVAPHDAVYGTPAPGEGGAA
jgi:aerobic-type carbon monoxide dehydrogenase small subunit (CoxS/CutS family)